MKSKLNWLLVGTGDIARKRVAPALNSAAGSRIEAVCDLNQEQARETALEYGIEKIYTDFDEAIDDSAVDAVYVATPVYLHSFMAVKAIDAGKHILVEKPLGISFDDAQAAVRAESCTDRVCGCAYFRRFYPRYSMLRDMIEAGEFGRLVLVRMSYFSWFNPAVDDPKYWRVIRKKSGGGPIADMGSHMFDVLIGLMGLPATASAMTSSLDRTWDVEDSSAMVIRMSDDTLVTAGFHWNSKTWVHMFEVVGTEAKVLWDPYDTGPVIKTVGREVTHIDMPNADNVHMPLIEDFIDAVRGGRKPLVTCAEAAKTNRLIDAVYRASSEKREVPV